MNTDQIKCCQLQDIQINAIHSLAFVILKKSRKYVIFGSVWCANCVFGTCKSLILLSSILSHFKYNNFMLFFFFLPSQIYKQWREVCACNQFVLFALLN
jgi:hypothetical protein